MSKPVWRPLHGILPPRLLEARLQAHHAVQWLARVARAYVPPQHDDAHTNLGWDDALDGFIGHPLKDGTQMSLRLRDLTLAIHDSDGERHPFPLDGSTDADARAWLGGQLGSRNLDAGALDTPSPYEMPPHAVATGGAYDTGGLADALVELAAWFANGNISLAVVQTQMKQLHVPTSLLRCWPHHFDLATLASFPSRLGETGYVGAGLSPGDQYYDEPYFYVSIYPKPDSMALPPLPQLGHWHLHEFTAAVLPAHKLLAARDRQGETEHVLNAAVGHAIAHLR